MIRLITTAAATFLLGAVIAIGTALGMPASVPAGTAADAVAYGQCMDYYHSDDQCRSDVYAYLRVLDGTVPDSQWDALLAAGWSGVPTDGVEALYPPAPAGV